ncbi:MAG TPA: ABC transporter permease [Thermoplasmata archaeon]|nr:ABC transporter permease [Thermoplasmata archaeon]
MRTEPAHRLSLFRGTVAFSLTEFRVQAHEGIAIFTSMITQVVLLIFVTILARQYLSVALLGAILFSLFTLGQRVLNEAAYIRVDHKLNQLYLASPLTPGGYFLGISVGVLLTYLGPILVLVAIAVVLVPLTPILGLELAAVGIAVWLFASSMGYVISTTFRDMRAIWSNASLLFNLFGVLPPVFYPVRLFPLALRPIALLMPPSAASAILQNTLSPGTLSSSDLLLAVVGLAVETVVMFVFAVAWARRTAQER